MSICLVIVACWVIASILLARETSGIERVIFLLALAAMYGIAAYWGCV